MLLLVLTYRHQIRLVKQDIRRHQGGVGKQAAIDVFRILGRLVLELGHTAQLSKHGIAVEHPAQLCMLVYVALDKQGVLLRVQSAGNVLRQLFQGAAAKIRRVLANRNGVQIRHKIKAVIRVRPLCPILDGSQVRAQGQVSGRLDAGEHSLFGCNFFHMDCLFSFSVSRIFYHGTEKNAM